MLGGRPMTLKEPMRKAVIVNGMARPSPRLSLLSVLSVAR